MGTAGLRTLTMRLAQFISGLATRRRVRFLSLGLILAAVAVWVVSFATARRWKDCFRLLLGRGYAEYCIAGTILNAHHPEDLYDFSLRISFTTNCVLGRDRMIPSPSLRAVLRSFSPTACHTALRLVVLFWALASLALFLAGFRLLWTAIPQCGNQRFPPAVLAAGLVPAFPCRMLVGRTSLGSRVLFRQLSNLLSVSKPRSARRSCPGCVPVQTHLAPLARSDAPPYASIRPWRVSS